MRHNLSKDGTQRARLFVAVEVPPAVQSHFDDFRPILRLVPPESLHVTVRFLGGVDQSRSSIIAAGIEAATSATRPFRLTMSQIGTFARRGPVRVVWMGLREDEGYESLQALYRYLAPQLALIGFEPERRPFAPHLTLARIQERAGPSEMQSIQTRINSVRASNLPYGSFDVATVALMRSDPVSAGIRYTPLARIPLLSTRDEERGDLVR